MALPYCPLSDLKVFLPHADETILNAVVESVSRMIDDTCNRRFYQGTETREYEVSGSDEAIIDDLTPTAGTVVRLDGVELTTAQYEFTPINDNPKMSIRLIGVSGDRVSITGLFGYSSAIPPVIYTACFMFSRIVYQALSAKQVTSERIGNYNVTFADMEQYPTTKMLRDLLIEYRRVRAHAI